MNKLSRSVLCIALLLLLVHCKQQLEPGSIEQIKSVTHAIDFERLENADKTPGDWMSYGRNYSEDRFSSLSQIKKDNIGRLGLAWSINLETTRGNETTPLVVDGIMYLTGPWSMVYAIDVRKGKVLWTYDPEVPRETGEKACCDVVNRGVALYVGHIFVGSLDGRLIALEAATGKRIWEVTTVDPDKPYTITGAPRVINGKVIIGNGGAEYGVRGYITAYDAFTGNRVWRFYTVPGDPSKPFESKALEEAAKTWTGQWWNYGGGGTAWDAMAYDPELNLLYVGTGNGSPWNREVRSPAGGDNLYVSSILAINPETGEMVWHYQTTPGDTWDYTATQHIILADIEIKGSTRKVLLQAPKNGFFYVIDRTNGKLIAADPYTYVNWARGVDTSTGRPIENDFSRYTDVNSIIAPSAIGGHNWQPMAFNPHTNLVYIPSIEASMMYGQHKNWKFQDDSKTWNTGIGYDPGKPERRDSMIKGWNGKLIAWDPVQKKIAWEVHQSAPWNAGVLTTKELVFQGTAEGNFVAYDSKSGAKIWETQLSGGVIASPITYMVDKIQYVSIVAGWGGALGIGSKFTKQINPGTIYTFALDKNEPKPIYPDQPVPSLIVLPLTAKANEVENGRMKYERYCEKCHKMNGGGVIPDLTLSTPQVFQNFTSIVKDGIFLQNGMPKFDDRLTINDISDIKNYIFSAASKKKQAMGIQ